MPASADRRQTLDASKAARSLCAARQQQASASAAEELSPRHETLYPTLPTLDSPTLDPGPRAVDKTLIHNAHLNPKP